jgi:hypothetical protein
MKWDDAVHRAIVSHLPEFQRGSRPDFPIIGRGRNAGSAEMRGAPSLSSDDPSTNVEVLGGDVANDPQYSQRRLSGTLAVCTSWQAPDLGPRFLLQVLGFGR